MSSMRNAVQRRNHKERAQPLEREKWGLLEKRKDYKLRAVDHKTKQKRLKLLKQKATERNPDEFSFAMMSSKVDSAGRKIADRGNKVLSRDVVKLLKTQDVGYLRTTIQELRNERKQVEQRIILDDHELVAVKDGEDTRKGKHTVYVEDREVQKKFKADEWFGTAPEKVDRVWNRPRKQTEAAKNDSDDDEDGPPKKLSKKQLEAELLARKQERATASMRRRAHRRVLAHLEHLKARERDMATALEELETQRAKMNSTIGGVNKHGVKFKIRERKR